MRQMACIQIGFAMIWNIVVFAIWLLHDEFLGGPTGRMAHRAAGAAGRSAVSKARVFYYSAVFIAAALFVPSLVLRSIAIASLGMFLFLYLGDLCRARRQKEKPPEPVP